MSAATPVAVNPARLRPKARSWAQDLRANWPLYLMALPAVAAILVFAYGPLFGLVVAFQDFSLFRGVWGSDWIGWANFEHAFSNSFFWTALRNSLIISGLKLAIGYPTAIILALMLNEVRSRFFKGVVQTSTILPFFISWVVAGAMFRGLLAPDGAFSEIQTQLLHAPVSVILSNPIAFRWVIIFQDTWKYAGYFAILYLAAMASIDPVLYEAAQVDGASRWQQTLHITLPGIASTMITLFVILVGYLVSAGFEQIYVMFNSSVYSTADILETFTLRLGLKQSDYGLATAVGMFQGVISLTLVTAANFVSRRVRHEGLF